MAFVDRAFGAKALQNKVIRHESITSRLLSAHSAFHAAHKEDWTRDNLRRRHAHGLAAGS